MKKFILISIAFILISQIAYSKFQWLETNIPNDNPYPGSPAQTEDAKFFQDKVFINNYKYLSITDTTFKDWKFYKDESFSIISCLDIGETGYIYLGTDTGLFKSTDLGDSFQKISNELPSTKVFSLKVKDNIILAAFKYKLFISTDNGINWSEFSIDNSMFPSGIIEDIFIIENDQFIIVGRELGGIIEDDLYDFQKKYRIFSSSDHGKSWTEVTPEFNGKSLEINQLIIDANDNFFILSDSKTTIYKSSDYGYEWEKLNIDINSVLISDLLPLNDGTFILSTYNRYYMSYVNLELIYNINIFWIDENLNSYNITNNLNTDFVLNKLDKFENYIYSYSKSDDKIYKTLNNFHNYNLFKADVIREMNSFEISYYENLIYSITVTNSLNEKIEGVKITPRIASKTTIELDSIYSTDSTNIITISNQNFDFTRPTTLLSFNFESFEYDNYFNITYLYELVDIQINANTTTFTPGSTLSFLITTIDDGVIANRSAVSVYNPIEDKYELLNAFKPSFVYQYEIPKNTKAGNYDFKVFACNEKIIFNPNHIELQIINEVFVNDFKGNEIIISPNPNNGIFEIKNLNGNENIIQLINGLGESEKVINVSNGSTKALINISDLPRGLYFVVIKNGDHLITKKVIIN